MTSSRVLLCVVVCCCGVVYSAVYHGKNPAKPAKFSSKEGCYIRETDSVIGYGAVVDPIGYCVRIECSKLYIHYYTCGLVSVDDPKCYVTEEDTRKPYPDCCPTVSCDTNYID